MEWPAAVFLLFQPERLPGAGGFGAREVLVFSQTWTFLAARLAHVGKCDLAFATKASDTVAPKPSVWLFSSRGSD